MHALIWRFTSKRRKLINQNNVKVANYKVKIFSFRSKN